MNRFFQVGVVWMGCAVGWMILGGTLEVRSDGAWSSARASVEHLWGPAAVHGPPQVLAAESPPPVERWDSTEMQQPHPQPAPSGLPAEDVRLVGSDVAVHLDHEQRQRGLNWFPTYEADFDGTFTHRHVGDSPGTARFAIDLSRAGKGFDGFAVTRDGRPVEFRTTGGQAVYDIALEPGEEVTHRVQFTTRGVETWSYDLTRGTGAVEDFQLALTTDFDAVDFPEGTLSPTEHADTGEGWRGEWRFTHLLSADDIAVELPRMLNPGPLAAKITFFGPVGLLFFFFVVAMVARVRTVSLHPMHYFFLGTGFFAFHLLFAYLVDQLPLVASFGLAAGVSVFLVVSYVRLVAGGRFAARVVAPAQLLYLVLFSASFFLEGMTGLAITLGAIGTLYVMMQMSARTRWGAPSAEAQAEAERAAHHPQRWEAEAPAPASGEPPAVF
jgi:hypothetical protein